MVEELQRHGYGVGLRLQRLLRRMIVPAAGNLVAEAFDQEHMNRCRAIMNLHLPTVVQPRLG